MISSRVLEIITSLSFKEQEALAQFLRSPYHNAGYNAQRVIELYEYVVTAWNAKQLEKLEKKHLNERYFPTASFQLNKKNPIDALASDLFKKMKSFILVEHLQNQDVEAEQTLAMANFYRRNNYEERFWQVIRQFRKREEKRKSRSSFDYFYALKIESEVVTFRSIFNTYTDDANLVQTNVLLDQFYTDEKLYNATGLMFQRQLGQSDEMGSELHLAQLITAEIDNLPHVQTKSIELLLTILQWLKQSPTMQELEEFHGRMMSAREEIDPDKFRNLMAFYRYFLGIEYRKQIQGENFLRKIFQVYKEHLQEGYFLIEEKLMPLSLKAIIAIALKLKEIDWAKQVLKDYPPARLTGTRYPEEAHSLCKAEVLFSNAEYKGAYRQLEYVNFDNPNYSILADILLIKIYYVLDNDLIYNRTRALEQKVRRSKIAQREKSSYLNFLKFLSRILKHRHNQESKRWQKLTEDIQRISPILEREWLQLVISSGRADG